MAAPAEVLTTESTEVEGEAGWLTTGTVATGAELLIVVGPVALFDELVPDPAFPLLPVPVLPVPVLALPEPRVELLTL
jgi:hypothetical protein